MKKTMSMLLALGIVMGGVYSCGDSSSQSSSNKTNNTQAATSQNNVQSDTEAAALTNAAEEVNTEPEQSALDETHVEKIMQWIDRSMTSAAGSHANTLYRSLEYSIEDIDKGQRKNLDGTYNSQIPAELAAGVNEYYSDISQLKNYCIVIQEGEIKACWVEVGTWTKAYVLGLSGDYDGEQEIWIDMGFTDDAALDEALKRLSKSYYGSMPKQTCSVYGDMNENNSGRSNEQPDINKCIK